MVLKWQDLDLILCLVVVVVAAGGRASIRATLGQPGSF